MADFIDSEKLLNFLESKGAVEVLLLLEQEDKRHSELEEEIPVAESTFHLRREEAVDLGLITSEANTKDGSVVSVYTLTPYGKVICEEARHEQVLGVFNRFLDVRKEFFEKREELIDWVVDEDSEFQDRVKEAVKENQLNRPDHKKHPDYK